MPRVVTWPEQQVSLYTVWTLGNILTESDRNCETRGIRPPRFVECEMRQNVSDNSGYSRKHFGILENSYM